MGFINEVVSDADIDRYGLPFRKGSGRWWTRDRERDLYLWGGLSGNPAFDEPILGIFQLHLAGETYEVVLRPGAGSISFSEKPYIVKWEEVVSVCNKNGPIGQLPSGFYSILKDSLRAFGRNGRDNKYTEKLEVIFGF